MLPKAKNVTMIDPNILATIIKKEPTYISEWAGRNRLVLNIKNPFSTTTLTMAACFYFAEIPILSPNELLSHLSNQML